MLRVAFFTDSFEEPNGVATLSREFVAYARRQTLPFFCVHSGKETRVVREESVTTLELRRGWASFPLDIDLYADPLLSRYQSYVTEQVRAFKPDLVHITGPGDMGIMGAWVAHTLHVPRIMSWHTNLHEYAGRRLDKLFASLPHDWRKRVCETAEEQSLRACVRFYRMARFLLAPNQGMVDLLAARTGKPGFLMEHGVDAELYNPARRRRTDGAFCIGYVGRLTPEKNVRLLCELEKRLIAAGEKNFRVLMVGDGNERPWLREHLHYGETPGVLHGDALADAFAGMDAFVFPSLTDTFGLVILEAMASGVPVIVSPETGRRVGVADGVNGFYAADLDAFTAASLQLMRNPAERRAMSDAARQFAAARGWENVFTRLYATYEDGLRLATQGPAPRT